MSRLFEALGNSADGAFVVDENLRIVYFNKAAESILGIDNEDATGRYCNRLLSGYDGGGHLVCQERCQVAKMSLNSKPVPNYDIRVKTNYGYKRWLNMSVFTYSMGCPTGKKVIVHLFHDINHNGANGNHKSGSDKAFPSNQKLTGKLTPREREILALLAKGYGTGEIAELLFISRNTVRNHVQNILNKLNVHSRLEAVTFAIKNNYFDC